MVVGANAAVVSLTFLVVVDNKKQHYFNVKIFLMFCELIVGILSLLLTTVYFFIWISGRIINNNSFHPFWLYEKDVFVNPIKCSLLLISSIFKWWKIFKYFHFYPRKEYYYNLHLILKQNYMYLQVFVIFLIFYYTN